jgi:hypothetical protein
MAVGEVDLGIKAHRLAIAARHRDEVRLVVLERLEQRLGRAPYRPSAGERAVVVRRSGRIEARSGLRMMPTFPRSPLSFRTAGFPRYGCKAGLSDGAFPAVASLKSAPDMRVATTGLHPPFVHSAAKAGSPFLSGPQARSCTAMKWHSPQPQGSSLGSGLCCPGPSSLNRPHPPHSQAHRDFAAQRLIRDAFAVRERLGDPRAVPSFR